MEQVVLRVLWVQLEHLEQLVHQVCKVTLASLETMELQVHQEPLVQQVYKVSKVQQVAWAPVAKLVPLALLVQKEIQAAQVRRVTLDWPVPRDRLDHLAHLVSQDSKVTEVHRVLPVHRVNQVNKVLEALKEQLVPQVTLDRLVLQELLETVAIQATLVLLDSPASLDHLEKLEAQEHKELLDLASQVPPGPPDSQEQRDLQVQLEEQVRRGSLEQWETQASKEIVVQQDLPVLKVLQVKLAVKVLPGSKVNRDWLELRDLKVSLDLLAAQDQLVYQVTVVSKAPLETKGLLGQPDRVAAQVCRVRQDHKVTKVLSELLALLVQLVLQVKWDHRGQLVMLDSKELLVKKDRLELLGHRASKEILDLEA